MVDISYIAQDRLENRSNQGANNNWGEGTK